MACPGATASARRLLPLRPWPARSHQPPRGGCSRHTAVRGLSSPVVLLSLLIACLYGSSGAFGAGTRPPWPPRPPKPPRPDRPPTPLRPPPHPRPPRPTSSSTRDAQLGAAGQGPSWSNDTTAEPPPPPPATRAFRPRPLANAAVRPHSFPPDFFARIQKGRIKNFEAAFVKPFDATQVYGWLTISDSTPDDPVSGKSFAEAQVPVLQDNLGSWLLTQEMFRQYSDLYGKKYSGPAQQAKAIANFVANLKSVIDINTDRVRTFWASCNSFCDLSFDEFKDVMLMKEEQLKQQEHVMQQAAAAAAAQQQQGEEGSAARTAQWWGPAFGTARPGVRVRNGGELIDEAGGRRRLLQALPSSVNWVSAGMVTPVKRQGQCGACWAFSVVGAVESAYMIANGQPGCRTIDLSEQQLVDCANANTGFPSLINCVGGYPGQAVEYIKNYWLVDENRMPYLEKLNEDYEYGSPICGRGGVGPEAPEGDYIRLASRARANEWLNNTQLSFRRLVMSQPVAMGWCVDNTDFALYGGGVYWVPSCGTCPSHSMLVTGYTTGRATGGGGGYWTLKNSWGPEWGIGGFINVRMSASVNGGKGPCGMYQWAWSIDPAFDNLLSNRC